MARIFIGLDRSLPVTTDIRVCLICISYGMIVMFQTRGP